MDQLRLYEGLFSKHSFGDIHAAGKRCNKMIMMRKVASEVLYYSYQVRFLTAPTQWWCGFFHFLVVAQRNEMIVR